MTRNERNYCDVCGTKIQGSSGHCRMHKFAIRRAAARVREENLLVDEIGVATWIWDARGEVLVIGQDSRAKALAMLDRGDLGDDADEVAS
jgi:hypothetical protein